MKIIGQGHMDGACFLYSIANAMQCLTDRTNKAVPAKNWAEMVSLLNASDFLDSRIGTMKTDKNAELQEQLALACISKLDPASNYSIKTVKDLNASSRFEQYVTKETVVLLPTQEHWYCLVDSQDKVAYLACSSAWQETREKYQEGSSPRLNRVFNTTIAFKDLKLMDNRAIAVSIKQKQSGGKKSK